MADRARARTATDEQPGPAIDPYSAERTMPADFAISVGEKGSTRRWLDPHGAPQGPRHQSMTGFDETYVDIVDYILRITHRIWEEKDIGLIYRTYRHNAKVVDDSGLQYGRDKIVADTVHTINAFPDVRLYADEVIWAGDDRVGFHTSHRTVIVGHNTGFSRWGPPTGRRVVVWAIANCVALENEIFAEHVIYNHVSLLRQLGLDVRALAREFGNRALDAGSGDDPRVGEVERLLGQGAPSEVPGPVAAHEDVEAFLRYACHHIWNWRSLNTVDDVYAATLRFHGPGDREYYGRGAYKSFVLSLLATFPDLAFAVDDVYYMGNEQDGYLSSTRWSALGTHRGFGSYGAPTGRQVRIWGISQHRIVGGRIVEEWLMFNEFEILQQLLRDADTRS